MSKIKKIELPNSFFVFAKTGARKTEIKFDDKKKEYVIDVSANPENNEANEEILKYISKVTGRRAKILSGRTSKKKLIRLE
jgi:uncharacterized protein YggU (UPF0235/DUF167 family)